MDELVVFKNAEVKENGIVFKNDISYEEWENCGKWLQSVHGSLQWWIGDWLTFGERKWGEMYSQAIQETTEKKYDTLRGYELVARVFNTVRRRTKLSWSVHREVLGAELEEDQDKILDIAERDNLSSKEVRVLVRDLNKTPAILPEGKFNVLYADPPWEYSDKQDTKMLGGAQKYYPSLSIKELCEIELPVIADDAVLFIWVTSPLLEDVFEVIKAWGFEYKTSFIWDKVRHNMGHYNSVRHELLLVCTRGVFTPQVNKLFGSVVTVKRSNKHSEKPEEFRKIIETLYPDSNKVELFGRKEVKGWAAYGNELQ